MTNETRLFVEVMLAVVVMVGVIGVTAYAAIDKRRRSSPDALDKLRRLVANLTDDMARQNDEMTSRMDEYDRRQEAYRRQMEQVHTELAAWKHHARRQSAHSRQLIEMLHEMGFTGDIPPPPEPPSASTTAPINLRPTTAVADDRSLVKRLLTAFNLEELRDLAFHLGIPGDAIRDDTVTVFARELVAYCRRRGMVERLRETADELRPGWDGGI